LKLPAFAANVRLAAALCDDCMRPVDLERALRVRVGPRIVMLCRPCWAAREKAR